MCQYFLKISSTFEQYRDNTDNRDNFGHYNRDKKFSYRYIPNKFLICCLLIVSKVVVKFRYWVGLGM